MSSTAAQPLQELSLMNTPNTAPVKVELIDDYLNPHDLALNGFEYLCGMAWGEVRKWARTEMSHIFVHPSLVKPLTEKELLIVPTESTLAAMKDLASTNKAAQCAKDRVHFLKKLPRQCYDYRVIVASTFQGQLSIHREAPCSIHGQVFQSDAHPFFVLYHALDDLMRGNRAGNFGPKEYEHFLHFFMLLHRRQPLYFFQHPYHGRNPRDPPDCYQDAIQPPRKRKLCRSAMQDDRVDVAFRPLKRLCRAGGENEWHGVESWRRGVTDVEPLRSPCDSTLRSYARERARPGPVLVGIDLSAHSSRRPVAAAS